ncbi:MAG: PDZ domain-containing protein [Aeromicrobium sp.]|uniref:YlbL family protein n=1 Tax=Aeromicrobium sp. TaxID=1871063 RepID=UPI003C669F4A
MSDADEFSNDADPMGLSRTYVLRLTAALSLIVLFSVALLLPVPYVTLKPGPAYDTLGDFGDQPMFTFGSDVTTYPTSGELDFTTVSVTRADGRVSLTDAMQAYFDRDVAVVPRNLVYPDGSTAANSQAVAAAQLDGSKDSSRVAALRAAGYVVPGLPEVAEVAKDGAAADVLKAGDLIRAVDGTAVDSSAAAVEAVSVRDPGESVSLAITRGSTERTVDVITKADRSDPTVPRIGITLGTTYDFPITIDNNVGREVGGPSAGAMFALAIYDRLTPGSLTGGRKIAGTGEISAEGVVGSIGGIQQKIAGAAAAGATIFLVPEANCDEAMDGDTKDLRLVRVATLEGAIDALELLAEDPNAKVPSCS